MMTLAKAIRIYGKHTSYEEALKLANETKISAYIMGEYFIFLLSDDSYLEFHETTQIINELVRS